MDYRMTDLQTRDLQRALRDALKKLAELPTRLKDEYQQAEVESREPITIQPLTAIKADLLLAAIEGIKDVSPTLAEVVGVQRKACRQLGNCDIYLRCENVRDILTAAGVKES